MSANTTNIWTDASGTVGTGSTTVIGFSVQRNAMLLHNPAASGGAVIAFNLTGAAAVINGAGSITLNPGGYLLLDTAVGTNAVTVIASAGGSAYTFHYMQ